MSTTYESLVAHTLGSGETRPDRTGTGTLSLFSPDPLHYDLRQMHVPLITSKLVPWRMALSELMWILSGSTNTHALAEPMKSVWDNWADSDGNIGPTYGAQYRHSGASLHTSSWKAQMAEDGHVSVGLAAFKGVDQLAEVVDLLSGSPNTRRALISLWSVAELESMALPPCMVTIQFSLRGPRMDQLHVHVYQRSADLMLGVPFDFFQIGVLAHLVAREVTLTANRWVQAHGMTWTGGDVHLYLNQLTGASQLLKQSEKAPPMRAKLELPTPSHKLSILDGSLTKGHLNVVDYYPMPAIKVPLAV